MRVGSLGALVVMGSAALPARAAEHARAELELERRPGTDGCIGAQALEAAVEARLGRDVFGEGRAPDLKLRVELEKREDAWRARLLLSDARGSELGRRELLTKATHCSALDASLALVVALLVDSPPERAEDQSRAAREEARQLPSLAPRPTTPIRLPVETFAPREPWRVDVSVTAALGLGLLPAGALGVRVGAGVRPPRFVEVRVGFGAFLTRDADTLADGGGGTFSLQALTLELCPLELGERLVRLSGCVGQTLGRLRARGLGFDQNRDVTRLRYDVTAGLGAWLFLLPRFGFRLGIGGEVPLTRDAFIARRADSSRVEVWRASPVAGIGEIGVGIEL